MGGATTKNKYEAGGAAGSAVAAGAAAARAREEQQLQRVSSEDSDVPVISVEILDLNLGPLAVGSFKDVYRARLRRGVPGIGNAGLEVAVLQLRHGTATLAAELQVFKNVC